jgi:hypothetical protein
MSCQDRSLRLRRVGQDRGVPRPLQPRPSARFPCPPSPWWSGCWIGFASVVLMGVAPAMATAQVVGVSASTFPEMRSDMPGGSGIHGWVTTDPLGFLRLGISAGQDRGRESGPGATCTSYWPVATGCVSEVVLEENIVTTASAHLQILAPRIFGFQLGVGPSAAYHHFGIRRMGETTGREERPVMEDGDRRQVGVGWIASLEAPRFLGDFLRIRLAVDRTEVDFPPCVMDAWGICGQETLTRFSVGVGMRIGGD